MYQKSIYRKILPPPRGGGEKISADVILGKKYEKAKRMAEKVEEKGRKWKEKGRKRKEKGRKGKENEKRGSKRVK
jgi:hypothetical protein